MTGKVTSMHSAGYTRSWLQNRFISQWSEGCSGRVELVYKVPRTPTSIGLNNINFHHRHSFTVSLQYTLFTSFSIIIVSSLRFHSSSHQVFFSSVVLFSTCLLSVPIRFITPPSLHTRQFKFFLIPNPSPRPLPQFPKSLLGNPAPGTANKPRVLPPFIVNFDSSPQTTPGRGTIYILQMDRPAHPGNHRRRNKPFDHSLGNRQTHPHKTLVVRCTPPPLPSIVV